MNNIPTYKFLWCWNCKWKLPVDDESLSKIAKIPRPQIQKSVDRLGDDTIINGVRTKKIIKAEFVDQPDQYKCQKCGRIAVVKTAVSQNYFVEAEKAEKAELEAVRIKYEEDLKILEEHEKNTPFID